MSELQAALHLLWCFVLVVSGPLAGALSRLIPSGRITRLPAWTIRTFLGAFTGAIAHGLVSIYTGNEPAILVWGVGGGILGALLLRPVADFFSKRAYIADEEIGQ